MIHRINELIRRGAARPAKPNSILKENRLRWIWRKANFRSWQTKSEHHSDAQFQQHTKC